LRKCGGFSVSGGWDFRQKSMQKKILVSVDDYETRIAILENGRLAEYFFERADQYRMAGNLYKGRVTAIAQGIEAAFVDIGIGRNAFLFVSDVSPAADDEFAQVMQEEEEETTEQEEVEEEAIALPPISIGEVLKEGQEILVQMQKEPIGTKGSRVTTNISLPGKYLVLLPKTRHIGVSRRIENEDEKERLRQVAESLCPNGMGMIIRTAAEGMEAEDFGNDLKTLLAQWERISKHAASCRAPCLVHKDVGILFRLVRDVMTEDVFEFVIDNEAVFHQVADYTQGIMPDLAERIKNWSHPTPLFMTQGVEAEISGLTNKKVWLNCGGYIVIDETEALTAIDVNTGRYLGSRNLEETVLVTNLEAAAEIARQLRLRDIGGIVIIDFIDMQRPENRELVLNKLQEWLKRDRTKTHVLEITRLGLVQMTRKRVRKSLLKSMTQPCPYCKREGCILSMTSMVTKVFRRLESICRESAMKEITLHLHARVANQINEEHSRQVEKLEEAYRKSIRILPAKDLHFEEIRDESSYDSASSLRLT
jgi:ribonuclease G